MLPYLPTIFQFVKEIIMEFLPITKQEMVDRGWEQCDFVYVCGDA